MATANKAGYQFLRNMQIVTAGGNTELPVRAVKIMEESAEFLNIGSIVAALLVEFPRPAKKATHAEIQAHRKLVLQELEIRVRSANHFLKGDS